MLGVDREGEVEGGACGLLRFSPFVCCQCSGLSPAELSSHDGNVPVLNSVCTTDVMLLAEDDAASSRNHGESNIMAGEIFP
jgi:hypothetical protein